MEQRNEIRSRLVRHGMEEFPLAAAAMAEFKRLVFLSAEKALEKNRAALSRALQVNASGDFETDVQNEEDPNKLWLGGMEWFGGDTRWWWVSVGLRWTEGTDGTLTPMVDSGVITKSKKSDHDALVTAVRRAGYPDAKEDPDDWELLMASKLDSPTLGELTAAFSMLLAKWVEIFEAVGGMGHALAAAQDDE